MLFLSQIIGRPVLDRHGEPFGKVRDLIVALGETYPPVTGVVVRVASGRDIFLPWSDVEELDAAGARLLSSSINIATFRQRPNEIRLWLDLLDKQIVDVEGRKIVRVNDIQLAPVEGHLRLVAVDVGLAGILRRLGLSGPASAWPVPCTSRRRSTSSGRTSTRWSRASSLKLRVPHAALVDTAPGGRGAHRRAAGATRPGRHPRRARRRAGGGRAGRARRRGPGRHPRGVAPEQRGRHPAKRWGRTRQPTSWPTCPRSGRSSCSA